MHVSPPILIKHICYLLVFFLQLELHQEALTISPSMMTVIPGKNSVEAEKVTKLFSLTSEFFKNLNY